VFSGLGVVACGRLDSSGRTDSRAMFSPTKKQAVPAIAAPTASQRKGLRHVVNNSGRSNLKVRLRYAKKALASPRAAPDCHGKALCNTIQNNAPQ
jgi:hypothetical protein